MCRAVVSHSEEPPPAVSLPEAQSQQQMYGLLWLLLLQIPPLAQLAVTVRAFCLTASARVTGAFSWVIMFTTFDAFCTCYQTAVTLKDFKSVYKIQ